MPGIGVLNEKPLHASLKDWYARPGDQFEVQLETFFIDIIRDDLLIEIQTRSFSSIKQKLIKLLPEHRVRLVYPIAQEKWLLKLAREEGGDRKRRKSPRKGCVEDLFSEMVSFPHLLSDPNFSLEVLLIREEEVRRHEENRNWRRRGWATVERRLVEVLDTRLFAGPADLRALLPDEPGSFTAKDLADMQGIKRPLAQKMAYCLRKAGVIELTGKQGRAYSYEIIQG